ncbi:MAG: TRAP transporter small permease subunit, partial [Rhodospirillaceae bacterium]|nr:TRAP transporter small permease subunit [Rhodospirillaceae bacterium]
MDAPASTSLLAKLERTALIGTRALSILGLVALMVLAFLTLANGLLRWAINHPIAGVVDVGALAIAIAVCCCLPVAQMERSHIAFRLVSALSPALGRILDAIASVAVFVVLVLMAWEFFA